MTSLTLCTFCAQCIATDGLPLLLTVRLMFRAVQVNCMACFLFHRSQTADLFPCFPKDGAIFFLPPHAAAGI